LLVINAAARSTMTADLILQHGGIAVWIVSPAGYWREIDDRAEAILADARLSPVRSDQGTKPSAPIPNSPTIVGGHHEHEVHPE